MASPADRLRRILSDGPGGPPEPAAGTGSTASAPAPRARRRDLRERLRALGLEPTAPPPPESLPPEDGAADHRPLEEQVGGAPRPTPHGPVLFLERRIPLTHLHGRVRLDEALLHPLPLRPRERGPEARTELPVEHGVFLDTETTGLAGGTGTVAFLVGAGRVEDAAFVVRQYCMRDFPEERALLHALLEDLGDAPLVTFNGRSFDWPLLLTRLRLHRMEVAERSHLDLLPPARRIWSDSLPSRTLAVLEEHVLGFRRQGDLPSWRVPQAWFEYLRTGRGDLVARAFRHNETDVVSMLALAGRMARILRAPGERRRARAGDHLGTARLLLDLRAHAAARRCLEAGLRAARGEEEARPLRRLLGHLCRRAGDHAGALAHWECQARRAPCFDPEAHEEAAKILEHRLRDLGAALKWVDRALERLPEGAPRRADFLHRRARIDRRLRARGTGA